MSETWILPERLLKPDGSERRVGVEIELQGIEIETLATLVAESLGGRVEPVSKAEYHIEVERHGRYRVEVDLALLKELAKEAESSTDESSLKDFAVDALGTVSSVLVPSEIVSPPIPIREVPEPMDRLVGRLRQAGAKGTRHSFLYAFGVHLNIEPPDLDPKTILNYLRAFVCLYPWILKAGRIDVTRQLTPFINPYSDAYEKLLVDPTYDPDWDALIDDYLLHNPTRDRALDMLPLFAHIDEQRVLRSVDDPLVNARPAFHYRLANSCVDEAGWSIAQPWNRWIRIESLAHDPVMLPRLSALFLHNRATATLSRNQRWIDTLQKEFNVY